MSEPQFPKGLVNAGQLYADIMTEIKGRIDFLQVAGRTGFQPPHGFPPLVLADIFYIEFRMICELIAVACLVAHGDVAGARSRKLLSEWKAGVIINQLGSLHSDFWPVPEEIWRTDDGKIRGAKIMVSGFMTREDLTALYYKCGDQLHRGSALDIRAQMDAGGMPWPDLNEFKATLDKFINLLRTHTIDLIDPKWKFWVEMESKEDKKILVRLVDVTVLGGTRSELLAKYGVPVDGSDHRPEEPPKDSPKHS